MASARAAPRGSSRSRHSFPVADCDTPRKAWGASTGNADARSVMMPLANRQDGPPFNDSHQDAATYTRHPGLTIKPDLWHIKLRHIVFRVQYARTQATLLRNAEPPRRATSGSRHRRARGSDLPDHVLCVSG